MKSLTYSTGEKADSLTAEVSSKDAAAQAAAKKVTRALLAGGIVAGPIYILVGALQIAIRPGFDITRHDLSLLSNGHLGWIQIANFLLTGALTILGAAGMRRALTTGRGRLWGPLLVGLYGLGLIGAGLFVADPMNGFPPGSTTVANTMSGHSLMHLVSGAVGFLGLIAACFVFARRLAARGQRAWAVYSVATGVLFFAAFVGIASGSQQAGATLTIVTLGFYVAVVLGWAWVSAIAARLMAELLHEGKS
jgi:hypothetical protein